jgi:hypothetical protein
MSAPTHVAFTNFATRFYETNSRATPKHIEHRTPDDLGRVRRYFIVRAFKIDDEIVAFRALLQSPGLSSEEASTSRS